MMRKIIAAAASLVAAAGIGIATAPQANASGYWKNGYFYATTDYANNVSGALVKTVSRYDKNQGVLYITAYGYDTVCDSNKAAVLIRAWDNDGRKWVYYNSAYVPNSCKGTAKGTFQVNARRIGADTIIVKDGIWGKTYGPNHQIIWRG
jgi:hypothetical protein